MAICKTLWQNIVEKHNKRQYSKRNSRFRYRYKDLGYSVPPDVATAYSETYLERPLPRESTSLDRPCIFDRRTYISIQLNLSPDSIFCCLSRQVLLYIPLWSLMGQLKLSSMGSSLSSDTVVRDNSSSTVSRTNIVTSGTALRLWWRPDAVCAWSKNFKRRYSSPSLVRLPYLSRNCGHMRKVAFGEGRSKSIDSSSR